MEGSSRNRVAIGMEDFFRGDRSGHRAILCGNSRRRCVGKAHRSPNFRNSVGDLTSRPLESRPLPCSARPRPEASLSDASPMIAMDRGPRIPCRRHSDERGANSRFASRVDTKGSFGHNIFPNPVRARLVTAPMTAICQRRTIVPNLTERPQSTPEQFRSYLRLLDVHFVI